MKENPERETFDSFEKDVKCVINSDILIQTWLVWGLDKIRSK